MRKSTIIVSVIAIGVVILGYRHFNQAPPAGGPMGGMAPGAAMPVSVAKVVQRDVQEWKEFSGRLEAVDQAEIRPRVTGAIQAIHFQEGAMVKKGDPLFTIDPRPFEADLKQAEAAYNFAKADLNRAMPLMKQGNITKRTFDERQTAARQAEAALKTAQLNLEYTHITAPIAGKVGRAELTVGNLVQGNSPNSPLLTTVVSNSPIYVDFEVDEKTYLNYVRNRATDAQASKIPVSVSLAGDTDAPHQGTLESFDNKLDAATGTIRARAVLPNADGSLVPGLFAKVKLGAASMVPSALITERAVGTDQNKKFVYVVGADNKVAYREVTLGAMVDGLRVATSGLKAEERIVVNGLQRVHPGSPVVPQEVPMNAPEPAPGAAPAAAGGEALPAADAPASEEKKS